MAEVEPPKVSIGLPVYNGERYIQRAIESNLGQTFADLELIICDNASTDGTRSICEQFARKDPRVRYYCSPTNRGAMWNFNRCFELARGEYFKWSAHDDLLDPTFIEKCVQALDANPDAALCHTLTKVVDDDLNCLATYDPSGLKTDHPSAPARFGARVRARRCIEIFGLMRTSALRNVTLFQSFVGADRALLAELAVEGRFLTIEEFLFFNGENPNRSTRLGLRPLERFSFYAPVKAGTRSYPVRSLYRAYLDIVGRKFPRPADRLRCYGHLVLGLLVRYNLARLVVLEPLGSMTPWLYDFATTVRRVFRWTGYRNVRPGNPIKIR